MRRAPRGVVPKEAGLGWQIAAYGVYWLLRLFDATLRYELQDPLKTLTNTIQREPVIFALWHNRLLLSMGLYRRFVQRENPDRRMAAMVSASRDGGILSALLRRFGVQTVRGSSSRRGAQALLELTGWGEAGYDLAITPDGPRGPRYHLQDGILGASQATQQPIVPVGAYIVWKYELRSWDRFQIPMPFSRIVVEFGRPFRVPRGLSEPERERWRQQIEAEMRRVNRD